MSGTGVPEGFSLPWNTTRTLADVWRVDDINARHRAAIRARDAKRSASEFLAHRKDKARKTAAGKIAFGGYDISERV